MMNSERDKAYKNGGWRERYAMDNGKETVVMYGGHKCLEYTYDHNNPYQDANGAMWDIDRQKWIF